MKQLPFIALAFAAGAAGAVLVILYRSSDHGSAPPGKPPQGSALGTEKPLNPPSPAHAENATASHASKLFDAGGWVAVMADINASVAPDSRVGRSILTARNLIEEDPSRTSSILDAMPPGAIRQRVMVNLASGTSPDAARRVLDWVLAKGFSDEVTSVYHSFSLRNFTMEDDAFIARKLDDAAHAASRPLLLSLKAQALAGRGNVLEASRTLSEIREKSLPTDYHVSIIGSLLSSLWDGLQLNSMPRSKSCRKFMGENSIFNAPSVVYATD